MQIKKLQQAKKDTITIRLSKDVLESIDRLAKKNTLSLQALIEAILKTALSDKSFVVAI